MKLLQEKNLQENRTKNNNPTSKPTSTYTNDKKTNVRLTNQVKNTHTQKSHDPNYPKMMSSNQETELVCQTLQDCPPLVSLTNVTLSSDDKHHAPAANKTTTTMIKTMKLCLPHPKSLDVLPSPTNKWSATTHPIKGWTYGFIGYHILYKHFYFHNN